MVKMMITFLRRRWGGTRRLNPRARRTRSLCWGPCWWGIVLFESCMCDHWPWLITFCRRNVLRYSGEWTARTLHKKLSLCCCPSVLASTLLNCGNASGGIDKVDNGEEDDADPFVAIINDMMVWCWHSSPYAIRTQRKNQNMIFS